MTPGGESFERILKALQERAKELDCLYRVDEILGHSTADQDDTLARVVEALPRGWQYPDDCAARIVVGDHAYETRGFHHGPWVMRATIVVDGDRAGEVSVAYAAAHPDADEGPFLKEERRLIDAIAERLG